MDDHSIVREGLRALLSPEPDIEIVGEAANGSQAVLLAKEKQPGVIVMDLAMPVLNGLEATRQITSLVPSSKVLVLTSYSNDEYVEQMLEAGAVGYLKKQTAAQDLTRAIREVHRGNVFVSPGMFRPSPEQSRGKGGRFGHSPGGSNLTRRELEVLRLIAQGAANKQMAAALGISVKTIEKHRQHLMKKLRIHDIAGLTRYAAEKGMIRVADEPGPQEENRKVPESSRI